MKITNNYQQNSVLSVCCLSVILALSACQKEGPAETVGKKIDNAAAKAGNEAESAKSAVSQKADAAGVYVEDSVITAKVKEALVDDDLASKIQVTTSNGVVKLNGSLASEQLVARAVEIVKTQKDVKSVQNELTVNNDLAGQ